MILEGIGHIVGAYLADLIHPQSFYAPMLYADAAMNLDRLAVLNAPLWSVEMI